MKKRFSFLKFILIILAVLLLACAGGAFYIYRKVNDFDQYAKHFEYDYEKQIKAHKDDRFEDHLFYRKEEYIVNYDVPASYLYQVITLDSMKKLLDLPQELEVDDIGIEPDFDHKKIDIYLSLRYRNLAHTCLKIITDLGLSDDQKKVELRYDDYYVIDDRVTEYLRKYVMMEKGTLMYTHKFPKDVIYYRMPDYRPQFIKNLSFENDTIHAEYDLGAAMNDYLSTTDRHEDPFDVCMEKVYLEMRMNGIAHD